MKFYKKCLNKLTRYNFARLISGEKRIQDEWWKSSRRCWHHCRVIFQRGTEVTVDECSSCCYQHFFRTRTQDPSAKSLVLWPLSHGRFLLYINLQLLFNMLFILAILVKNCDINSPFSPKIRGNSDTVIFLQNRPFPWTEHKPEVYAH